MVLDLKDATKNTNFDLYTHFSSSQIPGVPEGFTY